VRFRPASGSHINTRNQPGPQVVSETKPTHTFVPSRSVYVDGDFFSFRVADSSLGSEVSASPRQSWVTR
jgi:hypothetical protein